MIFQLSISFPHWPNDNYTHFTEELIE